MQSTEDGPDGSTDLPKLIRSEVERSAIRSGVDSYLESVQGSAVSNLLAHPLFLALIGFLLTAVIGATLEERLSDRADSRAAIAAEIEAARADELAAQAEIASVIELLLARVTRADLLRSAIVRDSSTEVTQRKRAYDVAYFEWNTQARLALLSLRQHVFDPEGRPMAHPNAYEVIVRDLVFSALGTMDSCLTNAFHTYRDTPGKMASYQCGDQPWAEVVRGEALVARNCMDQIMADALRYFRARAEVRIALAQDPESARTHPEPDQAFLMGGCT